VSLTHRHDVQRETRSVVRSHRHSPARRGLFGAGACAAVGAARAARDPVVVCWPPIASRPTRLPTRLAAPKPVPNSPRRAATLWLRCASTPTTLRT